MDYGFPDPEWVFHLLGVGVEVVCSSIYSDEFEVNLMLNYMGLAALHRTRGTV
jgi:hypothetical protein